jgi:lipopolysaccharide export system permease protein
MRSLIVIVLMITGMSLFFQDVIGPLANQKFFTLLRAMKQASPELEIPEGIFYDGIPGSNIYVQKKDLETGKLYGIMIYRQSGSYEDQAIILADSGMMQSTAEKMHLLLTLWNGEWFENMNSQEIGGTAEVPYRRETFAHKQILIDFDSGLDMDMTGISSSAQAKGIRQLVNDLDSINEQIDSMGHAYHRDAQRSLFYQPRLTEKDSVKLAKALPTDTTNIDSVFARLSAEQRQSVVTTAAQQSKSCVYETDMKADWADYINRQSRLHEIEVIGKFTLALSCIIFFFIGAPLGAIIRKGGLGVPVIISVLVFIVYYIFDNTGMRMAREDEWAIWFGKWISTMALAPLAAFFTYKANKDSTVFNMDSYKLFFMRVLGLRMKRNITRKEVIIEDPKYLADAEMLKNVSIEIDKYSEVHKLLRWPNPIHVFFRPGDDHDIEHINSVLEVAIEDLSYSTNSYVLMKLNQYPVIATHAHTRPFERKWLNVVTGLFLPTGLFFYFRMLRFRFRLYKDLQHIIRINKKLIPRVLELADVKSETPLYI